MTSPPPQPETAAVTPAQAPPPNKADADAAADTDSEIEEEPLDDLNLAPLRIHASRVGVRLSAVSITSESQQIASHLKRHSFDSKATDGILASRRGRSWSPSIKMKRVLEDGNNNSSFSTLEDLRVDPDIFYDKKGFTELDKADMMKGHMSFGDVTHLLTPVSERMSEDTLEDVHAFTDLSANDITKHTRPTALSNVGMILEEVPWEEK